jgi:histone-binding protein RBBP4
MLYDFLAVNKLDWPSLTMQWLPNENNNAHQMILGTYSIEDPNYLVVASVDIPEDREDDDNLDLSFTGKLKVDLKISHIGEINCVRYMPQRPNMVATKTQMGDVLLFDLEKYLSGEKESEDCSPELTLKLRKKQMGGNSISWSPLSEGLLISFSDDNRISLWDISELPENECLSSLYVFRGHKGVVEDVEWSHCHAAIFGSVGQDRQLLIWDNRKDRTTAPSMKLENAHPADVCCLSFNPFSEFLIATGSADQTIAIWDLRSLKTKVHSLDGDMGEVMRVKWSPSDPSILASSGTDSRMAIWDLSRVDSILDPDDLVDGPPELQFIHGGHTALVSDFSWNKTEPFVISSIDQDSGLHIWQMADHIYNDISEISDSE